MPTSSPSEPARRVRVAVLADTHLRGSVEALPARVVAEIADADGGLHAGGVLDAAALHVVLGNNDRDLVGRLPDRVEVDIAGVQVAMVHDTGARAGRENRMRRWFPAADVVVFGHSHEPWNAEGRDGQLLFNPGSAVQRRRQPHRTMGVLVAEDGELVEHRTVIVDDVVG